MNMHIPSAWKIVVPKHWGPEGHISDKESFVINCKMNSCTFQPMCPLSKSWAFLNTLCRLPFSFSVHNILESGDPGLLHRPSDFSPVPGSVGTVPKRQGQGWSIGHFPSIAIGFPLSPKRAPFWVSVFSVELHTCQQILCKRK